MKRTQQLFDLLSAMDDLLGAARLMYWKGGEDQRGDGDTSLRDSLDAAAAMLEAHDFPTGTLAEFMSNLESMLKSGIPPEQWRAMHNSMKRSLQ